MSDQIVLAWTVDVTGSSYGPAQAAVALLATQLYTDPNTDPVLGQLFGLSVESDVSAAAGPSTARRTLTLNMRKTSDTNPAPPPFPCHPRTSTPPTLPYPLRRAVTLPGSFFVSLGSASVQTSATQRPSLGVGDSIQFLNQQGVFYEVASVSATVVGLTAPYTGVSGNSGAFKEVAAPVTLAAIYSTSELDTAGVATSPVIPAGPGAQTVLIEYTDSEGNSDGVTVELTGKRPAPITLAPGTIDIAQIDAMTIDDVGSFGNSIGEITLVGLSSALPAIPAGIPVGTGIGAAETTIGKVGGPVPRTFKTMTDEAQLLIDIHLAYLPPSYFALAQQGASTPQLEGDFRLTTGEISVPTTVDQTAALAAGNIIRFAEQLWVPYTIATVSPKIITLTEPFSGVDDNNTGTAKGIGNTKTQGDLGSKLNKKWSGAFLVEPSPAAPPSDTLLSGPMAQFVALETAAPPPAPPGAPATVPVPTFLSGLYTRTLQLALAGVPVTPQTIMFV